MVRLVPRAAGYEAVVRHGSTHDRGPPSGNRASEAALSHRTCLTSARLHKRASVLVAVKGWALAMLALRAVRGSGPGLRPPLTSAARPGLPEGSNCLEAALRWR